MNEVLGQWLLVENHLLRAQEGIIRRNASLHTSVAMPCIVRQLPFFRRVFHELETQYLFTLLPTSILKPKGIRCRTCHSAGQQQRQEVCLHTLGRASFAMSFAMCMSSQ